ncbi:DegT/DnrJ/EryC1/StrS family aminotransferase [Spirulina subsalsa FACHB-351]|uniref:DegT/DnrJ/EryC1/StrS family aminotransferase n=1 Tax=Spirulina subsalsa FACHB-351 TaxID=234711 RepID=A0ABT3LBK8_9CYAN|nr:DegT/DnrJ/EryC1/StrS family aminotransferase [Spirulina subsalsa]MCW6038893.1 DegT/DnrJ/EryC1/StrS family aminotransferase [Spirulina subsalsa FACHB-351]
MNPSIPYLDLVHSYQDHDQLLAIMTEVIQSGWYILGPRVRAFEQAFAAYCQAEYCVGVGNGLEALQMMLRAAGIGEGDRIIVPANTYIATILAITALGAIPVLVEPRLDTLNLDPEQVLTALNDQTKAILAVHLYGAPADLAELTKIARSYGLLLFDDCAQSHGATVEGRRVGSWGDASGFSFFPTKNLGCLGDGGAVTTSNPDLAEKVRLLRNYGSPRKYYNEIEGGNSRLDELQAAILSWRLQHLDQRNEERRRQAHYYIENLQDLPLQVVAYNPDSVYHIFPLLVPERDRLQQFLTRQGIGTLIHYPIPPHQQPCYRDYPWAQVHLPRTEQIAQQELSLPLYPGLTHEQQTYIIEQIRTFYSA